MVRYRGGFRGPGFGSFGGFGTPFIGGLVGGLVGSALYGGFGGYRQPYPYYPYPYPYYYPYTPYPPYYGGYY
ncbi:hypothetical protein [Psychrobacillus antarcticus]|uniref:hypothetical protein n=1 Tax=Psychrobacillus antarcticus TaxID=2879115 RepID=UPI0024080DA5|nr:hypothetical protein [Psychrobacillus antarcticus]